jgi:hypothetical protein
LGALVPNKFIHSALSSLTLIVFSAASRDSTVASRAASLRGRNGSAVVRFAVELRPILTPLPKRFGIEA